MNIIEVFQSFKTQEQAVQYLEQIRWKGRPVCPYCQAETVCRHVSGDRAGQRWQCWSCKRTFAVTVGTIFHGTHIELRSWFLLLALMLNAKKSASAYQIARDLGMRRPTVWSMMHRIRAAMANDPSQNTLLHGIVEADEVYIGGKPRKGNGPNGRTGAKRGRRTSKIPVIGVTERGRRVIARVAEKAELGTVGLSRFIRKFVDTDASVLMTYEHSGYLALGKVMRHFAINHQKCHADGIVHANRIEGFWSLVKRAWYGSHHFYSNKYIALYIAEACFKFNRREKPCAFESTLGIMAAAV